MMNQLAGPQNFDQNAKPKYRQTYSDLRRALKNPESSPDSELSSENERLRTYGATHSPRVRTQAQLQMDRLLPDATFCAGNSTTERLMTNMNSLALRVPSEVKAIGRYHLRYASLLQSLPTTGHPPSKELDALALSALLGRIARATTRDHYRNIAVPGIVHRGAHTLKSTRAPAIGDPE